MVYIVYCMAYCVIRLCNNESLESYIELYLVVRSCHCLLLQQSSVCGAGLHSGVIDNDGGWLDVTRLGRKQQFTKSYKNGIQSLGYESVFSFYQKLFNTV